EVAYIETTIHSTYSDVTDRSSLDAQEFLEHLVGGGDDLRRGGIGPLGGDQAGELGRQVDGRGLELGGADEASPAGAGRLQVEGAAILADAVGVAADRLEVVAAGEGDQGDLGDAAGDAVVEDGGDVAALVDLDVGQVAEGRAVGEHRLDHRLAVILGQAAGRSVQVEAELLVVYSEARGPVDAARARRAGVRSVEGDA